MERVTRDRGSFDSGVNLEVYTLKGGVSEVCVRRETNLTRVKRTKG